MDSMRKSIALKFLPDKDRAPRVVASGQGFLSDLIKEVAENNSVEIIKNPELAEQLIQLPQGAEIPENLYRAVAAIFAYLHKIEKDLNYN